MPLEQEDIFWIIGLILILSGIGMLISGIYYLYWGSVVSAAEAGLAQYGYTGAQGAYYTGLGAALLIIGIILMVVGFFLVYKYKLKA